MFGNSLFVWLRYCNTGEATHLLFNFPMCSEQGSIPSDSNDPLFQPLLNLHPRFLPSPLFPPPAFKGWNITTSSSWLMLLKPRKSTSCFWSCEYYWRHSREDAGRDWHMPHFRSLEQNRRIIIRLAMIFFIPVINKWLAFTVYPQCYRQGGVRLDLGSRILLREGHQQCDEAGVGGCSLPPLPENCPQKP